MPAEPHLLPLLLLLLLLLSTTTNYYYYYYSQNLTYYLYNSVANSRFSDGFVRSNFQVHAVHAFLRYASMHACTSDRVSCAPTPQVRALTGRAGGGFLLDTNAIHKGAHHTKALASYGPLHTLAHTRAHTPFLLDTNAIHKGAHTPMRTMRCTTHTVHLPFPR